MNILKHKVLSVCIVLVLVCISFADTSGICSDEQTASCHEFANCDTVPDGNFTCTCKTNYTGDGFKNGSGCINNNETVEIGLCSFHQFQTCHKYATCSETPGGNFTCTCQANYTGDGLKAGSGCTNGHEEHECLRHEECHAHGHCNGTCKCNEGFVGDGFHNCTNINECNENPCHEDGICQDTIGSFTCVCKPNFRGDGFNCTHFCSTKFDCAANAICKDDQCECDTGYEGVGRFNCTDIDECQQIPIPCHLKADCTNTEGSFTCTCKNGYDGDGHSCEAIPMTCHEIYLLRNSVNDEEIIDPDGPAPLDKMKVNCKIEHGVGVTIMSTKIKTKQLTATTTEYNVEYEQSEEQIKAVINNSAECQQEQIAYCRYNAKMLNGQTYYVDAKGNRHYTWGGSTSKNKCECGQIKVCSNKQSSCNCDGTVSSKSDAGKLFDKDQLPVIKVVADGLTGYAKLDFSFGPVTCAPKILGLPKTCEEAKKKYNLKKNSPIWLDGPILVLCDVESYPHVAITTIFHDKDGQIEPNTPVQYFGNSSTINAIIELSEFCRQDVVYECQNSKITGNTYFESSNGTQMDYWPSGAPGRCACGMLRSCEDPDVECNCDILDGVLRKDMGTVTNKADLPVMGVVSVKPGNSSYTLEPLKCAGQQFGFEADCQSYFLKGERYSYPREIDPDGPKKENVEDYENVPPFLAECIFKEDPPQGITVLHHGGENTNATLTGELIFRYYYVSTAQLVALRKRAVYCTQNIALSCYTEHAPIIQGDEALVQWSDIEGNGHSYFSGKEGEGCMCGETKSCAGGKEFLCNCDSVDSQIREDVGTLSEKDNLPVMRVTGNGSSISVGPLQCYNNFPTCSDLYWHMRYHRLPSEHMVQNAEYTIKPAEGVEEFKVTCKFPQTEIPLSPGGGTNSTTKNPNSTDNVTECFDIKYGNGITPKQVQALVEHSKDCTQSLMYTCNNAPLLDHVHYKDCDGEKVPGFAGSDGDDKCSCGVTGTCDSYGGEVNNCSCEVQDSERHTDGGYIKNKDYLAVCQVCMTLGPVTDEHPSRSASYQVSPLRCSNSPIGRYGSCQAIRDSTTRYLESGTYLIDPDGFLKGNSPFLVYCGLPAHPPGAVTRVLRKTPEITPVPKEGKNATVLYFVAEMTFTRQLVEASVYCEQRVYVLCNGTEPPTERTSHDDWTSNADGTIECKDGQCSCANGGMHGGFVKVQSALPVENIILGPSEYNRELYVEEMQCFNIYKDCDDIKKNKAATGWRRGHWYAIDTDGAGGHAPFEVKCDFKTDSTMGITLVYAEPDRIEVEGQLVPKVTNIIYPKATPEQINSLAVRSGFCSQGLRYECTNHGVSDGSVTTFGGNVSSSFGTGDQSDVEGCACVLTKTCKDDKKCNCDAKGPMTSYDNGLLTDRDKIPLQSVRIGGESTPGASITATVGDVGCAPKPFNLHKDCEEVREDGYPSGEYMIWPDKNVDPFFVHCNMEIIPGHGVIVIGHNLENPSPFGENSTTKTVTYHSATTEQVKAVTEISENCYQSIKVDCTNTLFIGHGKFSWINAKGETQNYLGQGNDNQCSCAADYQTCGGDQTKAVLQTRKCSCDAGELQLRSDAGTAADAMVSVTYEFSGRANESLDITLGKLYCGQVPFDIDECATNMHDCHEHARCINKPGKFECACKAGWQGRGRSGLWANGRNCYDDNECGSLVCPHSATCENTPGSFLCHCKPGYTKTGPTSCKDIDECTLGTHNCHKNAICTNLLGTFQCRCKRGFKGNGTDCREQGVCSCFGDPHCVSWDERALHFQGNCRYTLSQDGCDSSNRTFQVLGEFWNKGIRGLTGATWIKTITFRVGSHVVVMGQDHLVLLNGYKRNLPARTDDGHLVIRRKGSWIEVQTVNEIQVKWNGQENVIINAAPSYKNQLCGLCGNYNDNYDDDWMIGPACRGQGQITDNSNKFGQSYTDIEYKNANPQCTFDCNQLPPPKDPCTGTSRQLAEYYCNKVFDKDGKFKSCLAKVKDYLYNTWKESCVFDACQVEEDREAQICKSAENLERECQESHDEGFINWRDDDMCATTCDEDKVFLPCATENNTRSCDSRTFEVTGVEQYEECRPGCYCREGLVMDGDKCVLPEQCGCLYNNFYYSVEEQYVDENCTTVYTCQSDRTFSPSNLTCHENATCTLKDGVYGCHCKRGYIGNGEQCEFDPCGEHDCNVDAECVPDGNSYRCKCQMGFKGHCDDCEDIDECATRTATCPPHSRCHNTRGSYKCVCIDGYTSFGDRCKDVNECVIGNYDCPSGTMCYNTPGKYHCEPCSDNSPPGTCCTCFGAKCDKPGEICGTDGKTYNTEADLILAKCETGKTVHVDYKGPCVDTCSEDTCPKWQKCSNITADGNPLCECEPCTPSEVNSTVQVCSNKLDLYINICQFKKIQCAMDREDIPIVNTTSPCIEKNGTDITTEWSPWSTCSVSCGNGTTSRHRHSLVQFDEYLEDKYPLNMTSDCFRKPCPGSPCETAACNVSQVCYDDGDEGYCTCPDCTDHGDDPVCGKIGTDYSRTYKNPCDLKKKACEKGEPSDQLYFGKCGTKPVNCSVMPNFQTQGNDKGCLSLKKVNMGRCDGACGQYTDDCCIPKTTAMNVTLGCPGHLPDQVTIDVVESCECQKLQLE